MGMPKERILKYDIETSEALYSTHADPGKPVYLSPEDIVEEKEIICIAWRWDDSKYVESIGWDYNAPVRDYRIVEEFAKETRKADSVVGHFLNGFDLPWMRTRCLDYELDPIPIINVYDTVKMCRPFKFPSKKLDYICHRLGIGKKLKTNRSTWKDVQANKPGSLETMMKYNIHDVYPLLDGLFERLRRYDPNMSKITNRQALTGHCPLCGYAYCKNGVYRTYLGHLHQRYICGNVKCRYTPYNSSRLKEE